MNVITINAKTINQYINDGNVVIVDIRNNQQFAEYHIRNSKNFPGESLLENLNMIGKFRMIILICDRGVNSLKLAKKLRAMNYNAVSVVGGMNYYRYYG